LNLFLRGESISEDLRASAEACPHVSADARAADAIGRASGFFREWRSRGVANSKRPRNFGDFVTVGKSYEPERRRTSLAPAQVVRACVDL
jgi:hypothetical protein